jgi:membrane protease YdiL (CAAX protease family)
MSFDESLTPAPANHAASAGPNFEAIPTVIPVNPHEIPVVRLTRLDEVPSVVLAEDEPLSLPSVVRPEYEPGFAPPARPREESGFWHFLDRLQVLLPPVSKPPYPGMKWRLLWSLPILAWSVLWSVVFLLVNVVVSLVVLVVTIAVLAVSSGDMRGYLDSLAPQAKSAPAAVASPDSPTSPDQPAAPKKSPYTPELGRALMPAMFVTPVMLVLFGALMLRVSAGKEWTRVVGLRRPSFTQGFIALLGLPGLMLVATAVHALSRKVLPGGGYQADLEAMFDAWPVWFGILVVGLGPGLCEELWCRGFLGRGNVGRFGVVVGVLVVSFLFGSMHLDPPHVVATAVMGMALHFAYLMTRSLWVPMFLHTVNNSTGVLATKFKGVDPTPSQAPWYLYAAAVLLLAAVAYALYRSRPRLVGTDGGPAPWKPDYPGVEHPPKDSGTLVRRPWPGWLASGLVALAVAVFAGGIYAAVEEEKAQGTSAPASSVVSAFFSRPF